MSLEQDKNIAFEAHAEKMKQEIIRVVCHLIAATASGSQMIGASISIAVLSMPRS